MKAVIMAGGDGKRLRPLTCTVPKPMARLCSRPVLDYILELLDNNGFDEAAVTLKYLPDIIIDAYPDGKYKNVKLKFITETKPLGTAGSVKNAAAGFKEPFLVISGDAVCDYDLKAVMAHHIEKSSMLTVVCTKVEDPREYGLLKLSPDNTVEKFVEKPGWSQITTDLANTGIYVLNPEVLIYIPDNKPFDFSENLFPLMMEAGMKPAGYVASGYWCDIGDFSAFKSCRADILNGKTKFAAPVPGNDKKAVKYTLIEPVFMGPDVNIGEGSVIGPNVSIEGGCSVGKNAVIKNSSVMQGVYIAENVKINSAVICDGAVIKRGSSVFEGAAVGSFAVIGENSTVCDDVLIWPEKNIPAGAAVYENVKEGAYKGEILGDEGIGGAAFAELSSERCARIGAAIASTKNGKRTGVGNDGSPAAKAVTLALISGLLSCGGNVWDFGDCFYTQLAFFTEYCGLKTGVFASEKDGDILIRLVGENGISVERKTEREIEHRYKRRDFIICEPGGCGEPDDMSSLFLMYKRELLNHADSDFSNINLNVECENTAVLNYVNGFFREYGIRGRGAGETGLRFIINNDAEKLEAFDEEGGFVPHESLVCLCCNDEFINGNDVAVPYDAPSVIDVLAEKHGRRAYRYSSEKQDFPEMQKQLMFRDLWVRDAVFMLVKIIAVIAENGGRLSDLIKAIPGFFVYSDNFEIEAAPSRLSKIIGDINAGEAPGKSPVGEAPGKSPVGEAPGLRVSNSRGDVLISPAKNGRKLKIMAEAVSEETAKELFFEIKDKIQKSIAGD
ncbi:MAG: sugar phosphate nucleotidyltransferase [Oscillospiraceae bacterium]|nr:sugar phosphate nucleotidyltransferase [Oscillospiraceae bacterium]